MKRIITLLASAALVAGALYAVPVAAQEAPAVPETANIDDPAGDANTTSGDQQLPIGNVSNVGDILKVWFSNDATKVNVHFQTAVKPPATAYGFDYRVDGSPNADGNCLRFRAVIPSGALVGGAPKAKVFDMCNEGANWFDHGVEGELVIADGPDDTGITTMTFDRSAFPALLGEGATITAPAAWSYAAVGASDAAFQAIRIDDTKVGTDYAFTDGGEGDEPKKPKKGKKAKKGNTGKKKGCPKGKGKKRGCEGKGKKAPKKGKPASCAAYVPGEIGKDQPTIKLTDEATEEKPVEQEVSLDMSAANYVPVQDPTTAYFNIQVDSKAKDAGLYALFEFPERRDYDLILFYPDGKSFGAESTAGNTTIERNTAEGTGHGGEAGVDYEKLVGIRTNDCQGWTMEASNWFGEGGDFTIKLWLGEAKIDPLPEGEGTP